MKTIMIWDDTISGHHLEYIHHIYEAALAQSANFVFVLPQEFNNCKNLLDWPNGNNVSFDFMSKEEISSLQGNYLTSSFKRSLSIRKYVVKHNVDEVFLTTLCLPYPLLPFILPRRIKVSGVIYQIYFYKWMNYSFPVKLKYIIETWCMTKSSTTKHPLILNDSSAAHYFNKVYKTDKCLPIVDPIVISKSEVKSDRKKYNISDDSMVFLHFGAMDARKGTLELLRAINLLSFDQLKGKVFVFAGKVSDTINEEFYNLSNKAKNNGADIIVYNGFCEYSMLDELCALCDYIVIPYQFVELSSGVVGHSAKFGKRLIGPAEGVIGKLIKQCPGSMAIKQMTPQKLADAIDSRVKYLSIPNYEYLRRNSIKVFQQQIMDALLE